MQSVARKGAKRKPAEESAVNTTLTAMTSTCILHDEPEVESRTRAQPECKFSTKGYQFTKRLPTLQQLPYFRCSEQLELRSLKNDLVMCYKIVFRLPCLKISDYFIFSPVSVTCGHPHKLFVPHMIVNTRKHFFCVCVIEPRIT